MLKTLDLINKLEIVSCKLNKKCTFELSHNYAEIVNNLGYQNYKEIPFDIHCLIMQAIEYYSKSEKDVDQTAISYNNSGVLLCNSGEPKKALHLFKLARELRKADRNIIENIQIAEIYLGNSVKFDFSDKSTPGNKTFVAYFDPHGM